MTFSDCEPVGAHAARESNTTIVTSAASTRDGADTLKPRIRANLMRFGRVYCNVAESALDIAKETRMGL